MFTAVEAGFWHEPRVLALAGTLRDPLAGAYVIRLREFCLLHGELDGSLRGYNAREISMACGWTGTPKKFTQLMAPWLGCKRGRFFIRNWAKSETGHYCKLRQMDAARKRKLREVKEEAQLAAAATSSGQPHDVNKDVPGTSTRTSGVRKEVSGAGAPPSPPPKGGGTVADARWDWYSKSGIRLQNKPKCMKLLAELSEDEWAHLQFSLPRQLDIYVGAKRRRLGWADQYLQKQRWLEIPFANPSEPPAKTTLTKAEKKAAAKAAVERIAAEAAQASRERASRVLLLLDALADPKKTQARKEMIRAAWLKDYPGDHPWEDAAQAAEQAHAVLGQEARAAA